MTPMEGAGLAYEQYKADDQCERNPLCTRGFKHRGFGGWCSKEANKSPRKALKRKRITEEDNGLVQPVDVPSVGTRLEAFDRLHLANPELDDNLYSATVKDIRTGDHPVKVHYEGFDDEYDE